MAVNKDDLQLNAIKYIFTRNTFKDNKIGFGKTDPQFNYHFNKEIRTDKYLSAGELSKFSGIENTGNITNSGNLTNSGTFNNSGNVTFEKKFKLTKEILLGNTMNFGSNKDENPSGYSFRINYEGNYFGTYLDALVIEKTDGNGDYPDGVILLLIQIKIIQKLMHLS